MKSPFVTGNEASGQQAEPCRSRLSAATKRPWRAAPTARGDFTASLPPLLLCLLNLLCLRVAPAFAPRRISGRSAKSFRTSPSPISTSARFSPTRRAPQNWKVSDADPKDKLVPAVKASLDFCSQALASLQDSKLGDTVKFFGGRQVPRARALIELTDDLEDHYSQLASYLRMNGMVPPSVRPAK